jgi:hypothetical protein
MTGCQTSKGVRTVFGCSRFPHEPRCSGQRDGSLWYDRATLIHDLTAQGSRLCRSNRGNKQHREQFSSEVLEAWATEQQLTRKAVR